MDLFAPFQNLVNGFTISVVPSTAIFSLRFTAKNWRTQDDSLVLSHVFVRGSVEKGTGPHYRNSLKTTEENKEILAETQGTRQHGRGNKLRTG